MRILTEEETLLVAGGDNPSDNTFYPYAGTNDGTPEGYLMDEYEAYGPPLVSSFFDHVATAVLNNSSTPLVAETNSWYVGDTEEGTGSGLDAAADASNDSTSEYSLFKQMERQWVAEHNTLALPTLAADVAPYTLTNYTLEVLDTAAQAVGLRVWDLKVNSTVRDPESQAAAMYTNLQAGKDLGYGAIGTEVKEAFDSGVANHLSKAEIIQNMAAPIQAGLDRGVVISTHMLDPSVVNTVDISYSAMPANLRQGFHDALVQLQGNGTIQKVLDPLNSADPAFHVEIKQPKP